MLDVEALRSEFPALSGSTTFLDGPAGTQVPNRVIAAVTEAMTRSMSNVGGAFATSHRSEGVVSDARTAAADLLGGGAEEAVFGPSMTALTFSLSRALAEEWEPGDRILLSRLDHDANVTPWVKAAAGRGVGVDFIPVSQSAAVELEQLEHFITERTRLVAITGCSNAFGSLVDLRRVTTAARKVGALTYVDAVHLAPHRFIDVGAIGCDFLVCSSYKFFGPHLGVMWGRPDLLDRLPAYKVRPAPDKGPGRWELGTGQFELLAGFSAAIDYLASIGWGGDRRGALEAAFSEIRLYEEEIGRRFLAGLPDRARVIGSQTMDDRVPTFAIEYEGLTAAEVARRLGERGIAVWAGHYYALEPMASLGYLERGGLTRIGLVHLTTPGEVDRALEALQSL
jgi:cysteine desulfurase family protein (TIGR01976 family)